MSEKFNQKRSSSPKYSIKSRLEELSSSADLTIDELNEDITNDGSMEELFDDLKYTGYNPKAFRMILAKIETDPLILKEDIKIMIAIGLERGTRWERALLKMSNSGIQKVNHVASKYRLISSKPKSDTEITISRVMSAYPLTVSRLLKQGKGRIVGDIPEGLPIALCHAAGASLIPKSDIQLYILWKEWRQNFSSVVNVRTPRDLDAESVYDRIIWDSPLYSNLDRLKALKSIGV